MKKTKAFVEKIALERIYRLFELAEQNFEKKPDFSKNCIALARRISTRNRARIPHELKKKFCKKCNAFLKEGKNCETEKIGSIAKIKCLECGFERKIRSG